MHISFSGVISPYTYHCPKSHFYRNIQKVKIEPKTEVVEDSTEVSKRVRGIELHDSLSQYLKQEVDTFPFITDTIQMYREHPLVVVEEQFIFDLLFSPLNEKPTTDFISIRPDAFYVYDGTLSVADWKFANPEYNASKHYNELEFFLAGLSSKYPDVCEAEVNIHFPEQDYTLPIRTYTMSDLARLQQKYIRLIENILEDKFFKTIPSKNRCYYCDYRSEDAGGSGTCEDSVQ